MNRDNYSVKDDEEVYFDCTILEKFDEKMHEFSKTTDNTKKDMPIDLMDFISKSDFTSVGGLDNTSALKNSAQHEEVKVDIRNEVSGTQVGKPVDQFFELNFNP